MGSTRPSVRDAANSAASTNRAIVVLDGHGLARIAVQERQLAGRLEARELRVPFDPPAPGALDGLRRGARGSRALDEHRAGAAEHERSTASVVGAARGAHQDGPDVTGQVELQDPEEAAEATDAEEVALGQEAPTVAKLQVFVWDEIRVTSPTNSATPVPITERRMFWLRRRRAASRPATGEELSAAGSREPVVLILVAARRGAVELKRLSESWIPRCVGWKNCEMDKIGEQPGRDVKLR